MSSTLPPELTDRIIDFLWDHQLDLRACSLVCSQWLPASRFHIFESITIPSDPRFLALVQCPRSVVPNHTRTLNFRLWPPGTDGTASQILHLLPNFLNLQTVMVGSLPPSPSRFPALPLVEKLSLHHTKFASCADFGDFVLKFTTLRELELGWVTWEDAGYDVPPRLTSGLEMLSIQGFDQAPNILQWLLSADQSPRTRGLTLYIPKRPDPASLSTISGFLGRLDGELQYLRLDLYSCPYLSWTLGQLELGRLSSLQRLRIGHGVYFYPPSAPGALGMLRAFPTVLGIALSVTSGSQLQELTFDVDISPHTWSFNSDPLFKRFLTNNTIERIPIVRFQVLRGRQSSEAVSWHCKQFASFMREKRFTTRDMIYFTEEGK
ncbi:hypothetical protein B0H14DRAFT_2506534 [Mycena olivaceomarginata]|nr:hypothetical protein B0H14DRAFT_2506534 [Mycena olivaceomarginata]